MRQAHLVCIALATMLIGSQPLTARPALPSDPPRRYIWDSWPVLAESRDGQCRLSIVGNGKIMVIRASGFAPGDTARLGVTNATMKPINSVVRADQNGNWGTPYLPLLWTNADGTIREPISSGTVSVNLVSEDCSLIASAPWQRTVRVID